MPRFVKSALLAVVLVVAAAGPAKAQNVSAFREALKKIDPQGDFVLKVETEDTLAWVYVSDFWYSMECFQRERIADNLRKLWRAAGGNQVVVNDRAGKTVADFKVFSSGWKIKGCS